jgi:hypothetical protein
LTPNSEQSSVRRRGGAARGARGTPAAREVRAIRRSLLSIVSALERLTPFLVEAAAPGGSTRRGRKLKLSPARRAALKLQGQYMGYLRGLPRREKAQVKALRVAKGIEAAIRQAKRLSAQ